MRISAPTIGLMPAVFAACAAVAYMTYDNYRTNRAIVTAIANGEIEVVIDEFTVQSQAELVPLQVNAQEDAGEETRLRYRFLDLRRERIHKNIILRSKIAFAVRQVLCDQGFLEIETPVRADRAATARASVRGSADW